MGEWGAPPGLFSLINQHPACRNGDAAPCLWVLRGARAAHPVLGVSFGVELLLFLLKFWLQMAAGQMAEELLLVGGTGRKMRVQSRMGLNPT